MGLVDSIVIKLEEIQGPLLEISNSMEIKVKLNLEHGGIQSNIRLVILF
jgi:hypothetical protein